MGLHDNLFDKYRPTKTNEKELDDKFKNHYTKIRFIKYMSTLIHFSAIEYDKKHNSYNKRYPLTLDQPLNSENETTMIDILVKHDQDIFNDIQDKYTDSENLTEYFECPYLILAINELKPKQKLILKYKYIDNLKNTEIARMFNDSPQNISKMIKKILKNLRKTVEEGKEKDGK